MAASNLECGVCKNTYNDAHRPTILPCSHTFCNPCINRVISTQNKKACPLCREEFTASSAEDLVLNRSLLDVAKQLSSLGQGSRISSNGSQESFQEVTMDIRQKITKKCIADCHEVQTQILNIVRTYNSIRNIVFGVWKDTDNPMEILQNEKSEKEKQLNEIDTTIKLLKNKFQVALELEARIQEYDNKLEAITDIASVGPVIDETKSTFNDAQRKINEIWGILDEKEKPTENITKEILGSKMRIGIATEALEGKTGNDSPINITVNDLRSLCGPLKSIVKRDVYAVKMVNGTQKRAKIKIESKMQILMDCLTDGPAPSNSIVIKHESLMELSPRRAFLNLWYNDFKIIIKVMDEGNLALNFLHACAGDMGICYMDKKFKSVGDLDYAYVEEEYTYRCGNTNRTNRRNISPVLSEVDWNKEKEREIYQETSWKEGQLRANFSGGSVSSIKIVTKDDSCQKDSSCFGKVENGLEVLKGNLVKGYCQITNCGLVISL